MTRDYIKLIKY